jgi:hypothetical protein
VIAVDLFPTEGQTPDLFEERGNEEKQRRLIQVMDALNHRYGQGILCRLAALPLGKLRFVSRTRLSRAREV